MPYSSISLHQKLNRRDLRGFNKLLKKELPGILIPKKPVISARKVMIFLFVLMMAAFIGFIQLLILTSESFNDLHKTVNSIFLWLLSAVWFTIIISHMKSPSRPRYPIPGKHFGKFSICKN